jgi:hypothetical protein
MLDCHLLFLAVRCLVYLSLVHLHWNNYFTYTLLDLSFLLHAQPDAVVLDYPWLY